MGWLGQAAAVITGVLAGLGVGGGGLLVIWLTMSGMYDQLTAQGINLVFFLFAGGASLFIHRKSGRISFKTFLFLAIPGIAGALAGCFIAALWSPALLRKCFGGLMLCAGVISLFCVGK